MVLFIFYNSVFYFLLLLSSVHGERPYVDNRSEPPVLRPREDFSNGTNASQGASSDGNKTVTAATLQSTILIIASKEYSVTPLSAISVLTDYGIPYETLIVPDEGVTLPTLNSSSTTGNYGAIVIYAQVLFNHSNLWISALSDDQWETLHAYQSAFGVRMVHLDVNPNSDFGTSPLSGGCCDNSQDQMVFINDTSQFSTAGIVPGATLSTKSIWHIPGQITDPNTTAFATFGTAQGFPSNSVAGVINRYADGRQQMAFFLPFASSWSLTANLLQHAWVHWATRGLYAGFRRAMLNTQVDDMFLNTPIWPGTGVWYRITPDDLTPHIAWMESINSRLPTGSNYTIEVGHNGNGNIAWQPIIDPLQYDEDCTPGPVTYISPIPGPLEFQKPLGTGTDLWPARPPFNTTTTIPYNSSCISLDPLAIYWQTPAFRDSFSHLSHTFSHEDEDNATYHDVIREISWNQKWASLMGLDQARVWSARGIIPPAISGVHNGDALRAWWDRGIVHVVGDNTRPLTNTINPHWPNMTTVEWNGFAGIQVTPRWATNIYYNCDTPTCILSQYHNLSSITLTNFSSLLALEMTTNTLHLLSLRHDAYMFHQANLRRTGAAKMEFNGVIDSYSLLQMWVEVVVNEFRRLVTWPLISLPHDTLAESFYSRMTRDQCNYTLSHTLSLVDKSITAVTISAGSSNTCGARIPVTVPGTVGNIDALKNSGVSVEVEQMEGDPMTVWVGLKGQEVRLELGQPVAW